MIIWGRPCKCCYQKGPVKKNKSQQCYNVKNFKHKDNKCPKMFIKESCCYEINYSPFRSFPSLCLKTTMESGLSISTGNLLKQIGPWH